MSLTSDDIQTPPPTVRADSDTWLIKAAMCAAWGPRYLIADRTELSTNTLYKRALDAVTAVAADPGRSIVLFAVPEYVTESDCVRTFKPCGYITLCKVCVCVCVCVC